MQQKILSINQLELFVQLGCSSEEKQKSQLIIVDMYFILPAEYPACASDDLKDTFCYDTLINKLKIFLQDKQYHLIEKISQDIYAFVQSKIPSDITLNIRLTKYPPIAGLKQGVSFYMGDR